MLQLKNIYKSYITGGSRQIALDGINLKFRESEFVTVLGPSGSGKTTFLNIIGGLERCDKGDLIINGKSTKEFTDSNWDFYRNNNIGFIFKNYNLIPHLSILENVTIAVSFNGLSKKEKQEKAIEALNRVGIKDYMRKTSQYLTKDEMQRVAIARALVNNPKIILADEPTGNLDSKSTIEIMNLIKEIFKDKLVILITQNPGIAKRYATRMITFRDGEVIEDTNPLKEDLHQKEIDLKRTHMKISMAIKLAIRDISNKKLRMFFYVLISSIGIMGIALIVALLQGFNKQISGYENDTLANYPIVINKVYTNYSIHNTSQNSKQTQNDLKNSKLNTKNDIIYSYNSSQNSTEHINQVNKDYIDYIKQMDKDLVSEISYESQINMNILREDEDGKVSILDTSTINLSSYPKYNGQETYLEKNYELLYGYYPTNKNEVVLIVDEKNRLDTNILNALGIDVKKNKEIKFDDLIGKEYKIILNDEFYKKQNGHFYVDSSEKNLKKLYNFRKDNNLHFKIFVSYIATKFTDYGVELIKDYFKDYCDEVAIINVRNQSGMMPEVNSLLSCKKNDDKVQAERLVPCHYVFDTVNVSCEGYLTACCADFENYLAYADLNVVSLKEAWHNQIITNLRMKHLNNNLCGTLCDNCIYSLKNVPEPLSSDLITSKITQQVFSDESVYKRILKK